MYAAWISAVLAAVAILVSILIAWRGRRTQRKLAVESVVRECEGRRGVWVAWYGHDPEMCYRSVQAVRTKVRDLRAQVPRPRTGTDPLETIKRATEHFCSQYELVVSPALTSGHATAEDLLEAELTTYRERVQPAIEQLCRRYKIRPGHRPDDDHDTQRISDLLHGDTEP